MVVLSYPLWQASYSGDPAIVGKQIELNGRKRTVIGVMPKALRVSVGAVSALGAARAFPTK